MTHEIQDGRFKFLNCKFRSEDVISKNIKRCACQGGSYTDQGYQCNKKNIFKINPDVCSHCSEFENN